MRNPKLWIVVYVLGAILFTALGIREVHHDNYLLGADLIFAFLWAMYAVSYFKELKRQKASAK